MSRILKPEGLRGIAMSEIGCELMLHLGRAAAQALGKTCHHPPVFYVSHDPRRAADALEAALCAGICAGGGTVHCLGAIPAAAMALLLSAEDAEAGIALTGETMPYEYITVRLYAKSGLPMSAEQLDSIAALIPANAALPPKTHRHCGRIVRPPDAVQRYLNIAAARLGIASNAKPAPLRIAVDCANGAASALAEPFFRQLGAEVLPVHHTPDGMNINHDCGVLSTEPLVGFVKDHGCHAGFAFDGSGERCIAIDEAGELLDGDRMLAILCQDRLERQEADPKLPRSESIQQGVAVTVLTNLGFLRYAKEHEIPVYATQSAPQFVLEMLQNHALALGGDGTGYLYFSDLPAADALMTAGRILQVMQRTGKPLGTLAKVMEHDPQVSVSVRIPQHWREIWKNDPEIAGYIATCEEELGMEGRLLVRELRGDAAIRILLEGRDFRRINGYAFAVAEKIQMRTGAI